MTPSNELKFLNIKENRKSKNVKNCNFRRNDGRRSGYKRQLQIILPSINYKIAVSVIEYIKSNRQSVCVDWGCSLNLVSERYLDSLKSKRWRPKEVEELIVNKVRLW